MSKRTYYINASALKEAACPAKFLLTVHDELKLKSFSTSRMEYGTAFHLFLADIHSGEPAQASVEKALAYYEQFITEIADNDFRSLFHLKMSCVSYYKNYKDDTSLEVLLDDDKKPLVETQLALPWYKDDDIEVVLTGTADMVAEHFGVKAIVDHKTTSAFAANFMRSYDFEIQTNFYSWLMRQLFDSDHYLPVLINALYLKKPSARYWKTKEDFDGVSFERKLFQKPEDKMDEFERWLHNKLDWCVAVLKDAANNDSWQPENQERSFCNAHFGRCSYQSICDASPSYRELVIEDQYERQPYKPLEWH